MHSVSQAFVPGKDRLRVKEDKWKGRFRSLWKLCYPSTLEPKKQLIKTSKSDVLLAQRWKTPGRRRQGTWLPGPAGTGMPQQDPPVPPHHAPLGTPEAAAGGRGFSAEILQVLLITSVELGLCLPQSRYSQSIVWALHVDAHLGGWHWMDLLSLGCPRHQQEGSPPSWQPPLLPRTTAASNTFSQRWQGVGEAGGSTTEQGH